MTTRTDQLLMALHVILRALLIHTRRPWLTHSDPDFDNIKVLYPLWPLSSSYTRHGKNCIW